MIKHALVFVFIVTNFVCSISAQIIKRDNFKNNTVNKRINSTKSSLLYLPKFKLDSIVSDKKWKDEYKYDENGNLIFFQQLGYDSVQKTWVNAIKTTFNFDNKFRKVYEETSYFIEDDNLYKPFTQTKYDTLGNILFYKEFVNPIVTDSLYYKFENEYNAENKLVKQLVYEFSDSKLSWYLIEQNENSYEVSGNLIQNINFEYDSNLKELNPYLKDEYSFDSKGNVTQNILYFFDKANNYWRPNSKVDYIKDRNFADSLRISYNYDFVDSTWYIGSQRRFYIVYDNKNNILSNTISDYYNAEDHFLAKIVYTYDTNILANEIIEDYASVSDFDKISNNNKILTTTNYTDWNVTLQKWDTRDSISFFYSEMLPNGINSIDVAIGNVYPNPFTNIVTFQLPNNVNNSLLNIYNINGEKVFGTIVENNLQTFDLSDLKSGFYYFKINSGNELFQGKLIKQ